MAEEIILSRGSKVEQYQTLVPQVESLLLNETDSIAAMANLSAALKAQFGFFWVGFYLVKQNELVLGPFQGPVACARIKKGKGVCGTSWENAESIIVPDVDEYPGHIACSDLSKSEVVIPLISDGVVWAVLDVDSDVLDDFDDEDVYYLEQMISFIPYNK